MKMSFSKLFLFLFIFTCFYSSSYTRELTITGTVRDSSTEKPIAGVHVYVEHTDIGTTTGQDGCFHLYSAIQTGTLVFKHMGFKTYKNSFHLKRGSVLTVNAQLQKTVLKADEITVEAETGEPEVASYRMHGTDIREMATPVPDPMQVVKTFPGVTSQNDQSNFYHVRGGSYDENLIRINGFTMYQPHIVRKGYLENPSLVNPLMVERMNLKTGGFPVTFSNKLSSVLDIEYDKTCDKPISALLDIRTTGVDAVTKLQPAENLFVMAGYRKIDYGYLLHFGYKQGVYQPNYEDFQLSGIYHPAKILSLSWFSALARSRFKYVPGSYSSGSMKTGFHRFAYNKSRQQYNFNTRLYGIGLDYQKSEKLKLTFKSSFFQQREGEQTELTGLHRYTPQPRLITSADSMLMREFANSKFKGHYLNSQINLHSKLFSQAAIDIGVEWNGFDVSSFITQYDFVTKGYHYPHETETDTSLYIQPNNAFVREMKQDGQSFNWYGQAEITPTTYSLLRLGVRNSRIEHTGENLFMTRALLGFNLQSGHYVSLTAGNFIQPPVYKEYLHRDEHSPSLKSQKSIMYTVGVKGPFLMGTHLKAECYYKLLTDMISYEIQDVEMIYSGENDSKAKIYGFDVQLNWTSRDDLSQRISYSFLKAREDIYGDAYGYLPMLSERRHQISLFLEDKMKEFKNSYMHLRIHYGSGFPFTPEFMRFNEEKEEYETYYLGQRRARIPAYGRFDVGFTQKFFVLNSFHITLREEILNLFDHFNVLSYSPTPWNTMVKNKLSGRVYNIGIMIEY
ncbi:MAG: TonB-dependent receptor [candidate division KSB1 bacterium]|nr:TonB-dependent receptor [candidate division KSB1 bacterium]